MWDMSDEEEALFWEGAGYHLLTRVLAQIEGDPVAFLEKYSGYKHYSPHQKRKAAEAIVASAIQARRVWVRSEAERIEAERRMIAKKPKASPLRLLPDPDDSDAGAGDPSSSQS